MKRNLSIWLGLLAFALLPALAQTPEAKPTGKIHGHVINPTGAPQADGSVSLSNDNGKTSKYTFPVLAGGEYSGEAAPGTYLLVFRQKNTPPDQMVDSIDDIKIVAGQDLDQDDDMSRKAFVDKLPAEEQKELADLKAKNQKALAANEIIKGLNADIKTSVQDFKDADAARATATQTLGATAAKADIDAKEQEIKTAKYTEVETFMLKDTGAKQDASVLWAYLGQAESGLKKYEQAEAAFKKALEVEAASKKPNPSVQGSASSGLGEVYARTGKVPEANAAYDAAAKANPPSAAVYLKNQAVIFSQVGNADAQVDASDKAIAVDPSQPVPYYLKGQGLIGKATIDAKTGKMILPPGCQEAYQKYLDLAPSGTYAADVKAILAEAVQTHSSAFGNDTSSKKKKNNSH